MTQQKRHVFRAYDKGEVTLEQQVIPKIIELRETLIEISVPVRATRPVSRFRIHGSDTSSKGRRAFHGRDARTCATTSLGILAGVESRNSDCPIRQSNDLSRDLRLWPNSGGKSVPGDPHGDFRRETRLGRGGAVIAAIGGA
jgi:hypothetical protein